MRLTFLLAALTLCVTIAAQQYVVPRRTIRTATSAAGPACSGTWTSGDTERFESGAGAFCTSGWTETDAGGVLSTYDTAQYVTGTHCLSATRSGSESNNSIRVDNTDDDASVRFYFRFSDAFASDSTTLNIAQVGASTSSATSTSCYLRLGRWSGNMRLDAVGTSASSGPTLSADTWYRIEWYLNRNAGGTLKVYAIGGAQVGSTCNFTSNDQAQRYWMFGHLDSNMGTATYDIFYDNITFDADGGDVGADE